MPANVWLARASGRQINDSIKIKYRSTKPTEIRWHKTYGNKGKSGSKEAITFSPWGGLLQMGKEGLVYMRQKPIQKI